ncbi:unnamed protein product, partial [Mesocestoides corti]|uniref:C2H2-type domain-containing protein n=1 Tax=Mesocestoides corti TaxID=53468 RepID=A0A0R3UAR8_MESCO
MNVLSSSKPSSLPPVTSTTPSPPPTTSTTAPPTTKQMTIGMALPTPPSKSRPLDLSAADRIIATAAECPKLLKAEEMVVASDDDCPPKLEGEKPADTVSTEADGEKVEVECLQPSSPSKSAQLENPASKPDEVSAQLKTLTDFFKTLASASNAASMTPDTTASLLALIGKKAGKDEAGSDPLTSPGSLEALHQLGWQLISLGRGGSNAPPIPPHPPAQSTSAPMWMPAHTLTSRSAQQPPGVHPPPPSLSGISMRGNQKYSAFYQHNRKQSPEESEVLRQSTVSQFHRLGFPHQTMNRRCNGPSVSSHGRPLYPTPVVSAETGLKSSLNRLQNEVASPPPPPPPPPPPSRPRETAFLCSCSQDFDSLYVFTLHMRDTGHKPRSSQPERDIPKLVRGQDMWINSETEQTREILRCMRCNQSFRSLPELTMHMMKTSHYSEIVYSDAGRNLLASQTFSSVGDRNRSGGLSNNWSSMKGSNANLKRSMRGSAACQNGVPLSTETTKPLEVGVDEKVNGHPDLRSAKSPKLEEQSSQPKCERPASSHEMHLVKPSPKPAASPEALSCPSELQRSAASSPRNEAEKHDQKYLNSPASSRGTASPRGTEEDATKRNCSDSVIRKIESFVEKSLPFPAMASPARPSCQQRQYQGLPKTGFTRPNPSSVEENEANRSTPDTSFSRKRRFLSGSSNSVVPPTVNTSLDASTEKRSALPFSPAPVMDVIPYGNSENPLSSLQKLVETTHQAGGSTGSVMKSPLRPFSQASEISPAPSNHSNDVETLAANMSSCTSSSSSATSQQSSIAVALSALQTFMTKVSSNTQQQQQQQQQRPSETPKNLDFMLTSNGEGEAATNWMSLLSAVLNAAKQSESETKRSDAAGGTGTNVPSPSKLQSSAVGMFDPPPPSVFTSGAFDFNCPGKPPSLPVHMTAAPMSPAGASMVANITKKAKCHFCGKPFANKGQVRLHISKNKCPCLLQQSAAAAMAKPPPSTPPATVVSASIGEKRPMPFSYPGFGAAAAATCGANPGPLGSADLNRLLGGPPPPPAQQQQQQQQRPVDTKPSEAAALAALLRHFNLPQPSRPVAATPSTALKPTDLLATLARATGGGIDANSANPLLSILFPPTAPAPPTPQPPSLDTTGANLTPEQKALFLFAQAMVSLAVAAPTTKPADELPQPPPPPATTYPLANFLQNFSFPLPMPPTSTPASDAGLAPINSEVLAYLNAIRQIASLGNASWPQPTQPPASTTTS